MIPPRILSDVAFPAPDGEPVFHDYIRDDIADDLLKACEWLLHTCPAVDERGRAAHAMAREALIKAMGGEA